MCIRDSSYSTAHVLTLTIFLFLVHKLSFLLMKYESLRMNSNTSMKILSIIKYLINIRMFKNDNTGKTQRMCVARSFIFCDMFTATRYSKIRTCTNWQKSVAPRMQVYDEISPVSYTHLLLSTRVNDLAPHGKWIFLSR